MRFLFRVVAPFLVGGAIALAPAPDGLSPAAWHYFALFVTVITLIITEPIPAAAIGMAGVTAAAVLGLVRETPARPFFTRSTITGIRQMSRFSSSTRGRPAR